MVSKKEIIGLAVFIGVVLVFLGLISILINISYSFDRSLGISMYMLLEYYLSSIILILIGGLFLVIGIRLD